MRGVRKPGRSICRAAAACLIALSLVLNSETPAYADTGDSGALASGWNAEIRSAGDIITTAALAGGAVGISWCAVVMLLGTEQAAGRAKSTMLLILLAVFAVCVLPVFIKLGRQMGMNYRWDPANLS